LEEEPETPKEALNPPPKAEKIRTVPGDCPEVCIECVYRGGPSNAYCGKHRIPIWKARRDGHCNYDYVDGVVNGRVE
jgi:hypothetical protein